jgi:hypothetical protein
MRTVGKRCPPTVLLSLVPRQAGAFSGEEESVEDRAIGAYGNDPDSRSLFKPSFVSAVTMARYGVGHLMR